MKQRIRACPLYRSPFTGYICKTSAKINEKYIILTPFDVTNKILGPYIGPNARETFGDKMELYFHDHSFVPLFIQAIIPVYDRHGVVNHLDKEII